MEKIKKYEIVKTIHEYCEEIKLLKVEDNTEKNFEILTIKKNNNSFTVKRILDHEIKPLVKRKINDVQQIIECDFDESNHVYYIVYDTQEEYEPINKFDKQNLLDLLKALEYLKKENRYGFMISSETVFLDKNNGIFLKFVGLFEIFKIFDLLSPIKRYLSPEVIRGKKPKMQDDIFSIGRLFDEYLTSIGFNLDNIENKYEKYSDFIKDIENINDPIKFKIKVCIHKKHKEELKDLMLEMNRSCYWKILSEKSEQGQIQAKFVTKNYCGRFYVDRKDYLFIPYIDNKSIEREREREIIEKEGEIAKFNFIIEENSNFNVIDYFEERFEKRFDKKNKLSSLNKKKLDLVKKWEVLPEKEKEFIEETAFKVEYTKRKESQSNNQNIIFYLISEFKDWNNIKELKKEKVILSIDDDFIGKIHDYNPRENFITIQDSELSIEDIPKTGELFEDIRQKTNQYKKQIEACKKFKERDMVNPDISGILATPEKMPSQNRIVLDYEEFEHQVIDENLKNDESQKDAVLEAIHKRPVYLIQGPPGTGKTTVIVELIQQLIRAQSDCKILITSQSNLAVDNVLERLPDSILFMRLASDQVIANDSISSKINPHLFDEKLKNWVKKTRENSENYLIKKFGETTKNKALIEFWSFYDNLQDFKEKDRLDKFHKKPCVNWIKRLFENVSSEKEIDQIFEKELGKNFQVFKRIQKDWFAFISNATTDTGEKKQSMLNNGSTEIDLQTAYAMDMNVVGATCIHIANSKYSKINFKFDYVIMDEASKASPAEALVPINMSRNLVLIGDHKQLPPIITREDAVKTKIKEELEDNGLDIEKEFGDSLFESLITKFEEDHQLSSYIKMLDIQYRMPKQIGDIISKYFYDGKLNNPDISRLPDYDIEKSHGLKLDTSIIFITTSNTSQPYDNDNKFDRRNFANLKVIQKVLKLLNELYKNNLKKDIPFNIGIIAGYRVRSIYYRIG